MIWARALRSPIINLTKKNVVNSEMSLLLDQKESLADPALFFT